MLTLVLKLLSSTTGILGTGSAVLALLLAVQTARLHHVKSDLEDARRANFDSATGQSWRSEATAQLNTSTALAASLDKQTRALAILRNSQDRANQAAVRAMSAARAAGDHDRANAKRILALKAGGDQCASADAAIKESLGGDLP